MHGLGHLIVSSHFTIQLSIGLEIQLLLGLPTFPAKAPPFTQALVFDPSILYQKALSSETCPQSLHLSPPCCRHLIQVTSIIPLDSAVAY